MPGNSAVERRGRGGCEASANAGISPTVSCCPSFAPSSSNEPLCLLILCFAHSIQKNIYIYIFFLWKRTIQCQENVREKSRYGTCVKFKSKGVNIDFIFHRSYFLEEELIQQILKLDLSINFIKVYIYHIGNKILQIFTYIVKKNVTICLWSVNRT